MLKIIYYFQYFVFFLVFSTNVYAFSSSSYLITQSAIFSHDYITASKHYIASNYQSSDLNILKKKLIALINANSLKYALQVANKINKIDIHNEEAWIVKLVHANINNDLFELKKFDNIENINNYKVVNYIFYKKNKIRKSKIEISNSLIDLVKKSSRLNVNAIEDYNYLLFYITLAVNINPENDEALFYQANFFQQLNNYFVAEEIYNKIDVKSPLYIDAQKYIAINKIKLGNIEESEKILIDLSNKYPNDNSIIITLANFYRSKDDYRKAIKFYSNIIDENNIDKNQLLNLFYMRGICFERIGDWKEAENNFLKALDIDSNNPEVLNYLAYGWIERDTFLDKSLQMLLIASAKKPESYYILDSLGWAYYKINDLNKAAKIMEDVIMKAPGEAISLDHLGDIYFALGRKREAFFMWLQAKDLATAEDEILEKIESKLSQHNAG